MINFKLTHHAENALVKRNIIREWLVLAFPKRIRRDATYPIIHNNILELTGENRNGVFSGKTF